MTRQQIRQVSLYVTSCMEMPTTRVPQNTYHVCAEHCRWTVLYREFSTAILNALLSRSLDTLKFDALREHQ